MTISVTLVLLRPDPPFPGVQLPVVPVKVSVYVPFFVLLLVAIVAMLCSIPDGFSQKDLG